MTFKEVLKKLNIEDYAERIWNSSSRGELFFISDYFHFAKLDDVGWFREWFESVVKMAEENWSRPESVFQHIPEIFDDWIKYSETHNQANSADS